MVPLEDVIMAAIQLVLTLDRVMGRCMSWKDVERTDLTAKPIGMTPDDRAEIELLVELELDVEIPDDAPDDCWRTPEQLRDRIVWAVEQTCWEPKQEVTG